MSTIMDREGSKDDYYRPPGFLFLALVPFGMALVTMGTFCPQSIPYSYMGFLGNIVKHVIMNFPNVVAGICYTAWGLHTFEGYYAYNMAKSKNLTDGAAKKWGATTFIYGVTSLKHLMAYEPKSKTS